MFKSCSINKSGLMRRNKLRCFRKFNGIVAEFNGVDAFMETVSTNTYIKRLPLTIEAWVKAFDRSDTISKPFSHYPNNIISNDIPNKGGHGFGLNKWDYSGGGCELVVEMDAGSTNSLKYYDYKDYNNEWVYVSVVYTLNTCNLYINGNLASTYSATHNLDAGNWLLIGKHNDDTGYNTARFYKGRIADVRIWDKALTQAEIQSNMNIALTGNEQDLLAYYAYSDGTFYNFVPGGVQLNTYNITYVEDALKWMSETWHPVVTKYTYKPTLNYPTSLPPLPSDIQKYILIFTLPNGDTKIESLENKGFSFNNDELVSATSPDYQMNNTYMLNEGVWELIGQQSINAISINTSPATFGSILWCNHNIYDDTGALYRASDVV